MYSIITLFSLLFYPLHALNKNTANAFSCYYPFSNVCSSSRSNVCSNRRRSSTRFLALPHSRTRTCEKVLENDLCSKLKLQKCRKDLHKRKKVFQKPEKAPSSIFQTIRGLGSKNVGDFLLQNSEAVNTGSKVFRLRLAIPGVKPIVVGDMYIAKSILCDETTIKPSHVYSSYNAITGSKTGFTLSDNNKVVQAIHKNVFKPSFASDEIRRMNGIMESGSSEWIKDVILPLANNSREPFDPFELCWRFTFLTYMESAFEYKDVNEADFKVVKDALDIAFPFFLPYRNPLASSPEAKKAAKGLQDFAHKVLDSYRHSETRGHCNSLIKAVANEDVSFENDKERTAEIVDLIIGTFLTTGSFLSSMLIQLARNPGVSETFQKHLDNNNKATTFKYLENIISETERLNSPSLDISSIRLTGRDFYYEIEEDDGKESHQDHQEDVEVVGIIPKGSIVLVSKKIASKNADIFSDPEKFIPERWEEASSDMRMARSFTMFSTGSRSCPGRSVGYNVMYCVLPKIMSEVSIKMESQHGGEFIFNGLVSHYQGVQLSFSRRDRSKI